MKVLEAAQRTEAWHAARRGLPTASRFAQIVTATKGEPSTSQERLINELLAESIAPPEQGFIRPNVLTPEMEQGMIREAEARCSYELEFAAGEKITECGLIIHDSGLFGGSPDGLVGDNGGVEIKCPMLSTHIGYVRASVLPSDYRCQVHGLMIVTGRAWWDFFSYARNCPPFWLRVHRDHFTQKLETELIAFCQKYNEARAKFDLPRIGNL
jgi:hypothetical protein